MSRESIIDFDRAQYRRVDRLIDDTDHARTMRRAIAVKLMSECTTKTEVAQRVNAARSSINRWEKRYREDGVYGLKPKPQGAPRTTVNTALVMAIRWLVSRPPQAVGYAASRWTSPLLAEAIERLRGIEVHPSTLRRLLPKLGYRWRRARHTESWRQDPQKEEKLEAIRKAVDNDDPYTDVFFVDEAQIELLPKVGFGWRPVGQQTKLVTPGRNKSRYVAGALHKDSGRLTWTDGPSHNTELLLELLKKLHLRYRRSKKIIVIMDNAPSHTSNDTQEWLEEHDRFEVRWQPTYTPSPNRIEKLWNQLHSCVTRNHRHRTIDSLMDAVRSWLDAVDTFPNPEARSAEVDDAVMVGV